MTIIANQQPIMIVVGAAGVIGAQCVVQLQKAGYYVIGTAREAKRCRADLAFSMDLQDAEAVLNVSRQISTLISDQTLRGLVVTAASVRAEPLANFDSAAMIADFAINVVGPLSFIAPLLDTICRSRSRIIFTGSPSSTFVLPFMAGYCSSKAALDSAVSALRMELRPWKIPVILIEPSAVATNVWAKLVHDLDIAVPKLPRTMKKPYIEAIAAMKARLVSGQRRGMLPTKFATHVVKLAMREHLPARKVLGADAKVAKLMAKWLPDAARELLACVALGFPDSFVKRSRGDLRLPRDAAQMQ